MKVTKVNEVTDDVRGWVTTFYLTVLSFNETADQGEFSCSVSNNVGVDTYSIAVQEACRYFFFFFYVKAYLGINSMKLKQMA